jgi:hypothetical protein
MSYSRLGNLEEIYDSFIKNTCLPSRIIIDNILPFCFTSSSHLEDGNGSFGRMREFDISYFFSITFEEKEIEKAIKNYEKHFFRINRELLSIQSHFSFWKGLYGKDINEVSNVEFKQLKEIFTIIYRWISLLEPSINEPLKIQTKFNCDDIILAIKDNDLYMFLYAFLRGDLFSDHSFFKHFENDSGYFLGMPYNDFSTIYFTSWFTYYIVIERFDENFKEYLTIVPDDKRLDMLFLKYRIDVDEASKVANTLVDIYRYCIINMEHLENC